MRKTTIFLITSQKHCSLKKLFIVRYFPWTISFVTVHEKQLYCCTYNRYHLHLVTPLISIIHVKKEPHFRKSYLCANPFSSYIFTQEKGSNTTLHYVLPVFHSYPHIEQYVHVLHARIPLLYWHPRDAYHFHRHVTM